MSSAIPASASAGDSVRTRAYPVVPGLAITHPRRPQAEVDADTGDAALTQSPGQPVEERVGRGVDDLVLLPHTAAIDEVHTKKSSGMSAAASLKYQAPQTFPANTRSISASSWSSSGEAPSSPAACTMPASGGNSSGCGQYPRDVVGVADVCGEHPTSQPYCSRIASMRRRAASLGGRRPVRTRCPRRARPDTRRSPVRPRRVRRSPDTSHHGAIRAVWRSAAPPAGEPATRRGAIPQRDLVFALGAARMWAINPDQSSAPPAACPRAHPRVRDVQNAARPKPHRKDCTGETVSARVTRCAPRVTTQMGRLELGGSGPEDPLRSTEDAVLHPVQRVRRRRTVRVEAGQMHDAQRGRSASRRATPRDLLFVGVGSRHRGSGAGPCAVSRSASGATVSASSAIRSQPVSPDSGAGTGRPSPSRSRTGRRLWSARCALVVLGGKLFQDISRSDRHRSGRRPGGEFIDPAPLQEPDGLGARPSVPIGRALSARTSTSGAGTGRWADRPCGPPSVDAAKSGRWPAT